jgi:benzoyl-CoA reductase subunit C
MEKTLTTLDKLESMVEDPYERLAQWKEETGNKIFGCLPMYVPEEIIHAAGIVPIVLQESNELITLGHTRIQSFFCGIVRSLADLVVKFKLDFLDGFVSPDICLAIRGLANIAEMNMTCYHRKMFLPIAFEKHSDSRGFLIDELKNFKESLEEYTGKKITDEALKKSFKLFNENRALLREIYELRRNKPGLLNSTEMRAIVGSSMLMPKEENNELLKELIAQLKDKEAPSDGRAKLVVSGSLCSITPTDILNIIENAGAIIVDDDLYIGSRYFKWDVKTEGDPIEALADRHLETMPPCPTRIDQGNDWADYLLDMVKKSNADGVIHLIVKYCQPHDLYYPYVAHKLTDNSIPHLMIETEHEIISTGQTKTRIEAFIEMIKGE